MVESTRLEIVRSRKVTEGSNPSLTAFGMGAEIKITTWDEIYSEGGIHERPSNEMINLVPLLKQLNINYVLDAGCGTGRHALYLSELGFKVHAIDVSRVAIKIAQGKNTKNSIEYCVGTLTHLPYSTESMDFVLASHSLEYCGGIKESFSELNRVLRRGGLFFLRVVSTQHPFYGINPDQVYGFSHVGFCIKNHLPVHFFREDELKDLFVNYKIERLKHLSHPLDHKKISVPLREWVLLGYKN